MDIKILYENIDAIIATCGGLGLFLLGIIILSGGLKQLAGNAVRVALMRFTRSPLSGAITGSITTALLQSSSATTVAAVGFVGAGLIGFSESLGIIFGANLGTTITGWIVVLFGFKFKINNLMMIFILVGVLLRLFAKGRVAVFGYTLAGFSLIFIALTMMQNGMSTFAEFVTPSSLPDDSFIGRFELLFFGIIFTIITQSSSAGVAMALTALFAGAINFQQAAALVIGMDVGTTVTAVIATLGQSIEARRTGFSHVIYNFITAFIALALITPFSIVISKFFPTALQENAEISLVAFHSFFNLLSIIIILPFTPYFARLIKKLVPESKQLYTDTLDSMLLDQPTLALQATQKSLHLEILALFEHINAILGDENSKKTDIKELQNALDKTHAFIDKIELKNESGAKWKRLVSMIHTLDHMQRLHERCEEDEDRAITLRQTKHFSQARQILILGIKTFIENLNSQKLHVLFKDANKTKTSLHDLLKPYRETIVQRIAKGEIDVEVGTDYLEGVRWLRRVSWHLVRISYHYEQTLLSSAKHI